ncbi:C-C motif chemokine 16 isoform X2 [Phyllostomus hastatus]|uniref:C-C motif chemokine 16 isoform X2 n=1 Tax=Phyllostomus hastatus TaxID=9423 RepID=UPI001E682C13|nr:C-C motif chemokine 16 isoform X2 [Phyllostomus hastatus]
MKASTAALFLLILTLTITSVSPSQTKMVEAVNVSHTCCMKYQERVLPRKLVAGYRKALNCHLPAIIFVTKKQREICANPSSGWVQGHLKDPNLPLLPPQERARMNRFDRRKTSGSTPHDNQAPAGAPAQGRKG